MTGKYKAYTIGRGELSFARSAVSGAAPLAAAMFRYLGNSPELSQAQSPTKLDHYDADHGLKVKDDSILLQLDRTGKFKLDSMDVENIAMQFVTKAQNYAQEAAVDIVETVDVVPGYGFQLGTSVNAMGLRNLTDIAAAGVGGTPPTYTAGVDYVVDPATGWVKIPDGSSIIPVDPATSTPVEFTFSAAATERVQIISASDALLEGALRYRSTNVKGPRHDYFWPYVQISPDGDFSMKGDTWLEMSFTFDILDPSDGRASMYIDGLAQQLG